MLLVRVLGGAAIFLGAIIALVGPLVVFDRDSTFTRRRLVASGVWVAVGGALIAGGTVAMEWP